MQIVKAAFARPDGSLRIGEIFVSLRIFIDTEFTDFQFRELISIGAVTDHGLEFYAELTDFDLAKCNDFVRSIVLPKLGRVPAIIGTKAEIGTALKAWVDGLPGEIEICVDFMGDWELFSMLLQDGGMLKVPEHIICRDIWAKISDLDKEQYWMDHGGDDHHALQDARANKYAFFQNQHRS